MGLYGEPSRDSKHLTWEYLCSLHNMIDLPWFVLGDFNEMLMGSEKEGGALRPQRCMQSFRDTLNECNLFDMGFVGDIFTWRRGETRERKDRAVCDQRWNTMFPLARVINDDCSKSVRRPIVIDTNYLAGPGAINSKRKRVF